jgi:hypothetical protein
MLHAGKVHPEQLNTASPSHRQTTGNGKKLPQRCTTTTH